MKRVLGIIISLILLFTLANYFYVSAPKESTPNNISETSLEETHMRPEMSDNTLSDTEVDESTNSMSSTIKLPKLQESIPMTNITILDRFGNQINLTDLKGKPLIINFWATWCPPCKEEMPIFQSAYKKYKDKVQFIMINATDSKPFETSKHAKEYLDEQGIDLPVYFDQNFQAQTTYAVTSLPSTLIINSDGMIEYALRGPMTQDALEEVLSKIK